MNPAWSQQDRVFAWLQSFVEPALVDRLGWTLAHSIWQFTVVAAVMFLCRQWLTRYSSQSRYLVGCTALTCMVLLTIATFVLLRPPVREVVARNDNSRAEDWKDDTASAFDASLAPIANTDVLDSGR